MTSPYGRPIQSKVKQSSSANQRIPSTFTESAVRNLLSNSCSRRSATDELLEHHLLKDIPAWSIILIESRIRAPLSASLSAPERKSSTYRLSCSSLTAGDGGKEDKWCCIVAFNRNGLQQFPKGTRVNRIVITSSSGCHKNRWTSLSSSRMLIWWNASMSAVTATGQRRTRTRISVRFERRQGPTSMQSFKDIWL